MIRAITAGVIAFVAALVVAAWFGFETPRAESGGAIPPEMAGNWTGDARIAVNWTIERTLSVLLTIDPSGQASGTIGDAVLLNGHVERNRTAVGRALRVKTDWVVRGDLQGDLIKAEGVRRERVNVPLNWIDDHFEGSVNTSGSHFGGKEKMWLAAQRLKLSRIARVPAPTSSFD